MEPSSYGMLKQVHLIVSNEKKWYFKQTYHWYQLIIYSFIFNIAGEFIRDLVALKSGGSGGVVWRIRASATKLVCAVGSRNGTEETKLLVLDFDAPLEK